MSLQHQEAELSKKNKKLKIPAYLSAMNEIEKEQNHKIIRNMNKRINFLKNPRFENPSPSKKIQEIMNSSEGVPNANNENSPFRVNPPEVVFTDYKVNCVYEIKVTLTNVSGILRRIKVLPPSNPEFSILPLIYPSSSSLLAPGMSALLPILFQPSSLSSSFSSLFLLSEEDHFKIELQAKRESPCLNLSEILDCQSCWVGDRGDMSFRICNKGGEGGFRWEGGEEEGDGLKLKNFLLYPREFYLKHNESIELFINFNPEHEGLLTEQALLACDDLTSKIYTLKGKAHTVNFLISNLDERDISTDFCLETLFFPNSKPGKEVKRKVVIENKTEVKVDFHWGVSWNKNPYEISHDGLFNPKPNVFSIQPSSGSFPPSSKLEFFFTFQSATPSPYYQYASLILDDIPLPAIGKRINGDMITLTQAIGTDRPSIEFMSLALVAEVDFCQLSIQNPIYISPGFLFISKSYTQTFFLTLPLSSSFPSSSSHPPNTLLLSPSSTYPPSFPTPPSSLPPASSPLFPQVKCMVRKRMTGGMGAKCDKEEFIITGGEIFELKVNFWGEKTGRAKAVFEVENEYGNPVSFEIIADFIGPQIKLHSPKLNFGLIKAFSMKDMELIVENISEIQAKILFKNSKSKEFTFDQVMQSDSSVSNSSSPINSNNPVIFFSPTMMTLAPNSKQSVKVHLRAGQPESIKELIEVLVQNGKSLIIELYAEVQPTILSLNRTFLEFPLLFAGNLYETSAFSKTSLKIQNLGNIPTKFKWLGRLKDQNSEEQSKIEDLAGKEQDLEYWFEPKEGVIGGKAEINVKFFLKPLRGGKLEDIFICECEGMDYPIGFEINTSCYRNGLTVLFELLQDENGVSQTKIIKEYPSKMISTEESISETSKNKRASFAAQVLDKSATLGTTGGFNRSQSRKSSVSRKSSMIRKQRKEGSLSVLDDAIEIEVNPPLTTLSFENCVINTPRQLIFHLKNTSGIQTSFSITSLNYPPPEHQLEFHPKLPHNHDKGKKLELGRRSDGDDNRKRDEEKGKEDNTLKKDEKMLRLHTLKSMKSTLLKSEKSLQLLTSEQEKSENFFSTAGRALNKAKQLQHDQKLYLTSDSGLCLLPTPSSSILPPSSSQPITLTLYNDICGEFTDSLQISVKGLPIQTFPVRIRVKGSPLKLSENQVGISQEGGIGLGEVVRKGGRVGRRFFVENTGPKEIGLEWGIFEVGGGYERRNFFDLEVGEMEGGWGIKWKAVEPERREGEESFLIEPRKAIIKGRQKESFMLTFESERLGDFKYVLIGRPSLMDGQRADIEDLAVQLSATTIKPYLELDKRFRLDGSQVISFEKWALMESNKDKKSITFINKFKTNLILNLSLEGPFKLVSTQTTSSLKYPLPSPGLPNSPVTFFNLSESSSLQTSIQFIPTPSLWPLYSHMALKGKMIINFSNGDTQIIDLEGHLKRPWVYLNMFGLETKEFSEINEFDFGLIHVKNTVQQTLYLGNSTPIPAKWHLLHFTTMKKNMNLSKLTKTQLEFEEDRKTDEPDVFEFSLSEGILMGPTVPISCVPIGRALPKDEVEKGNEGRGLTAQKIFVSFMPKKNVLYKSRYRISVQEGNTFDFTLKGTGTYDEDKEK